MALFDRSKARVSSTLKTFWNRPWPPPKEVWLGLLVLVYFGFAYALSYLRYEQMRTRTADLGVMLQTLWSYNHGAGFFESFNYELSGAPSLLAVHPAPFLVVLAAFYWLFPGPVGLLVLQAAVVALAAVPLFYLTSDLTGSKTRALIAAGVYLVWAPLLAANLYDFHLEAFLPIELFSLMLLWRRGSYLVAIVPAVLAWTTLEVGPPLVAAVGVFFLLPPIRATLARAVRRWRAAQPARRFRSFVEGTARWFWKGIRTRRALASLALVIASGVAYFFLRLLQIWARAGQPAGASTTTYPAWEFPFRDVFGSLSLGPFLAQPFPRLEYWLLLYALLGFIPLLAPRTLIVSLPWILYSLVSSVPAYTETFFQYDFIAASVLFIGFAYGMRTIGEAFPIAVAAPVNRVDPTPPAWAETPANPGSGPPGDRPDPAATATSASTDPPPTAPSSSATPDSSTVQTSQGPGSRPGRVGRPTARRIGTFWTGALIAVILLNLLLSPADPYITGPGVTAPGYGTQYTWGSPTSFNAILSVASLVPNDASILATEDLFPFVADDVHAYTTTGSTPLYPPFNATHLPTYVFLSDGLRGQIPSWLPPLLWNSSVYGVRATIGDTPQNPVYLFQLHYTGPSENLVPFPLRSELVTPPSGVIKGDYGKDVADATTYTGEGIESLPKAVGNFFHGVGNILPAGNIEVTVYLKATLLNSSNAPSHTQTVLELYWNAWERVSQDVESFNYTELAAGHGWAAVTMLVNATVPLLDFQLVGAVESSDVVLELNYYQLTNWPTSS